MGQRQVQGEVESTAEVRGWKEADVRKEKEKERSKNYRKGSERRKLEWKGK